MNTPRITRPLPRQRERERQTERKREIERERERERERESNTARESKARPCLTFPRSGSLGLTDYSQVDMLDLRFTPVDFKMESNL